MIRPFRLRDAFLVRELAQVAVRLDPPEAWIRPMSPLLLALGNRLFQWRLGAHTLVTSGPGEDLPSGFGQIRQRGALPEWEMVSLAPSLGGHPRAAETWGRLLDSVAELAGARGAFRVFAKVDGAGQAQELLGRAGYHAYAVERIWEADQDAPPRGERALPSPRLRRPEDLVALQQLYKRATPGDIQAAEGRGTAAGVLNGHSSLSRREYVWHRNDELVAHLVLDWGVGGCCLSPSVAPGDAEMAEIALSWGVKAAGKRRAPRVLLVTRHYDAGSESWARASGFSLVAAKTVMAKHLAVRVKEPVLRLEPSLERRPNTVVTRTCDEYRPDPQGP